MSLNTIFHVEIDYMWMLVPFIIFASLAGWYLLITTGSLIYGFCTKGWSKVMDILEENHNIQKRAKRMSKEAIKTCRNKLME